MPTEIRHIWSPADDSRYVSASESSILARMIERHGLHRVLGELALIACDACETRLAREGRQLASVNLKIHAASVAAEKAGL